MDETKTTKIRPGLLVGLTSRVEGGVAYQRENLDPTSAQVEGDGKTVEKWTTTKIVEDAAEHERAAKVVGKARGLITRLCSKTPFGLLCPKEREAELDTAVAEARRLVREYNASATFTHARIYSIKGSIASSDEESARAIGEEVAQLVAAMNAGIDRLDPDAIRKAADNAKQLQEMLGPDQAETIKDAISQARKAARAIVKRVQNEGESAAIVLKDLQRGSLEKARIAFLDLSEQTPDVVGASMPAVNVQRLAGLDLDDAPAASDAEVQ